MGVHPLKGEVVMLPATFCYDLYMSFGFKGGPEGMELKGYDKAMMDSNTGLTNASLTSERKQSAGDAE